LILDFEFDQHLESHKHVINIIMGFRDMGCYSFIRDQHEALIPQLFHIRQSGSVADYVESFSLLVDQLTAYEIDTNPLYYVMRFVDGLSDEVKSMVMIQRPSNLDEACVLALVQEEAIEFGRKREYRRFDYSASRGSQKSAFPLSWVHKLLIGLVAEDAKTTKAARTNNTDDKLCALKQYCRAKGLCDRCAEKWSLGHHCAPTVQLHAIQELWELMPDWGFLVCQFCIFFWWLVWSVVFGGLRSCYVWFGVTKVYEIDGVYSGTWYADPCGF
jgi:hypothetical protein